MRCFYHSADLDGRCSGAIVKNFLPDCQMIGIDYGEPFPWDSIYPNEDVIMADFSLQPFSDMERLNALAQLLWIDHHKSAIEDAKGTEVQGILDTEFSACELAWKHFSPDTQMPLAVRLLGRYDIWKHADEPDALSFQYGCKMYDTSFDQQLTEFWKDVIKSSGSWIGSVCFDGRRLLSYERMQNAAFMSAYGFDVDFDGLRCIAANRGMSNSLLFESKWNHNDYDAMLMFAWKNGQWTVSLYTDKPGVDVSVICKARGGGGHVGAAGFQCKELPFLTM